MTVVAGSSVVVEGITSRPDYAYQPPAAFFASGPPTGAGIYDIRTYGAQAGAGFDNRPAIQAAIVAANAAGGGIVYVPEGVWGVSANPISAGCVQLLDNVFLKGAGANLSSLTLMDGSSTNVTGIVRSKPDVEIENWGVADLSIDGNKQNTTGEVDGFFCGPVPGQALFDKDVYVLRVEIHDVSRYGFDPHEQTVRLSIRDSVSHHNGFDGFTIDFISDSEFVGNEAYANGRHGFNVVTQSHDLLLVNNVAYDNAGAGFVVQRGSENRPGSSEITITGGASYGNGREGVLVQLAQNVIVSGMDIHDNGFSGVRIYGSSHTTIEGNTIHDNSQAAHDTYAQVNISSYVDTVYGATYAAHGNLIQGNTISDSGTVRARYGIEERVGATDGNVVNGNVVSGAVRAPIELAGQDSYVLHNGTAAGETITGTQTQDHLLGLGGGDVLLGGGGEDVLLGDGALLPTANAASIHRLYLATLSRGPDPQGHIHWTYELDHGATLQSLAAGFVGSVGFQTRYGALDNNQFVTLLYQNVLHRAPDTEGLANWAGAMAAGTSRESVVVGFSQSAEFIAASNPQDDFGQVYRLYASTLDRAPDAGGFDNWINALGGGMTLLEAAGGFVGSAEFQANYGALDDATFVELLYNNVLDRASDPGGLASWVGQLAGGASRASVVLGFSESQELQGNSDGGLVAFMRTALPTWNDTLQGGLGDDQLAGGRGMDRYAFALGETGHDHVYGLERWDELDFSGFGYVSANDALAHVTQSGQDVVFSDRNVTITFHDTALATLAAAGWVL